jgi:hypothetical protein
MKNRDCEVHHYAEEEEEEEEKANDQRVEIQEGKKKNKIKKGLFLRHVHACTFSEDRNYT